MEELELQQQMVEAPFGVLAILLVSINFKASIRIHLVHAFKCTAWRLIVTVCLSKCFYNRHADL